MRNRGFTLIELVVAMFITAIVAAMGYAAINQALGNRTAVEAQAERLLSVQKALRIMEQDFELAQPRPVRNLIGDGYEAAMVAPDLSSTLTSTASSTEGGTSGSEAAPVVTLTRGGWTNTAGLERSELQRVAYYVENGTLIRMYKPVLDATTAVTSIKRDLLTDVTSLSLRFMDVSRQWRTSWPTTELNAEAQTQALRYRPIAVEVTVVLKDWGTLVRIYEIAG
ncbi:MAG: type II secretion system minor pseudopilin GspJ [Steroidobacteraceae bacterium]